MKEPTKEDLANLVRIYKEMVECLMTMVGLEATINVTVTKIGDGKE